MKHRILSAALSAFMLASLAACGSSPAAADTAEGTTAPEVTDTTAPEVVEMLPDVEKKDYDGAIFNILAPKWGLYKQYFFADEQTGEAMNDAIYERVLMVEEYLGVDITHQLEGTINDVRPKVEAAVMSGDEPYQLVLTHCIQDLGAMVTEELLYDWNTLPGVNLTREYWNQSCNEYLELYGKQYYANSDFMLADPNGVLFNKTMIDEFKLESPFKLVREGKWTIDKMFEMGANVTTDLDGSGTFDLADRYGVTTERDWINCSFLYSSGLRVTENADGAFKLNFYNDKMVDMVEKLYRGFIESGDALAFKQNAKPENGLRMDSGRVLFQIEALVRLSNYRETTVDFGILPYPKLDEAQEGYTTNDWSGLMAIPAAIKNPEMVGEVCEMLAYYSGDTTIPAYYDLMLGEKLARDTESKEMLELIFDGITYDPAITYLGFSSYTRNLFYTVPYMIIEQASNHVASWYEQNSKGAEAEIEDFLAAVKK
ncbi:MAG: hypothetical protein IJF67_13150 [Clostridia bacterium]|nr:hypothetical protein [Clostridia bacterium]